MECYSCGHKFTYKECKVLTEWTKVQGFNEMRKSYHCPKCHSRFVGFLEEADEKSVYDKK